MEILRQPFGITHEMRRMNRYGVLEAYIPEFKLIVGQMQHDLYHTYTVDEHTLKVLRNTRRLFVEKHADELPLGSKIAQNLPNRNYCISRHYFMISLRGAVANMPNWGRLMLNNFAKNMILIIRILDWLPG